MKKDEPEPTAAALFNLQRPSQRRLSGDIASMLTLRLQSLGLKPGARLPAERDLADSLQVGRSTIREAITQLEAQGVVEVRHGRGTFVTSTAAAQLSTATSSLASALLASQTAHLMEARLPVERMAARLAAQRRSPEDLQRLELRLKAHKEHLDSDGMVSRDSALFHIDLAESAHNDVLSAMVRTLLPMLEERGPILEPIPGYRTWEYEDHRAIAEAVREGDADRAESLIVSHIENVGERYRSLANDG